MRSPMGFFDYGKATREAGISSRDLGRLGRAVRREFPQDRMMYELHLLRACLAVRDGRVSLRDILGRPVVRR